jgi:hypothetical protein
MLLVVSGSGGIPAVIYRHPRYGDIGLAGWEASDLVVETTYNTGVRLTWHYRLDPAQHRLLVKTRIRLPSLAAPVEINSVYDKSVAPSAG